MENTNQEQLNNDNKKEDFKPDDNAGFYVRNFLRIYDPESGQVAVETTN